MFAPSNTFITKSKKLPFLCLMSVLLALFVSNSAIAQEKTYVEPLKNTHLSRLQYDMFAYVSRGYDDDALFLLVLNNNLYNKRMYSKSTHACIGLNEFINIQNNFGANIALGYTRERIAEDKGLLGNNGVYTNWLNTDINLSFLGLSAGMCFDVFLGSQVINKDNFSYEGINENCFNKYSTCFYLSTSIQLSRLKVETRYGVYGKSHINANKIAYYNFLATLDSSSYYEIRVYYRFYTSGNRKKSPFDFLSFFNIL